MEPDEDDPANLLNGLSIDTSGPWQAWDWKRVGPQTSYDSARLEEYRDRVIIAYRLYNRIGLEHARRMLAHADRTIKILDAGGGTGRKAIPLAKEGFTDITILDHAPEWLRLADEKALQAGVRDHLTLVEGDVRDLRRFADGTFDYVLALGGVVSYCGAPAQAIHEMARVLKPGGGLLADGIHSRFASLRFAARMGDLAAFETGANAESPAALPALFPEELERYAHQAGLTDIRIWSEFLFDLNDQIRADHDQASRWEELILKMEMRYYDDPRFLGVMGLILRATKGQA